MRKSHRYLSLAIQCLVVFTASSACLADDSFCESSLLEEGPAVVFHASTHSGFTQLTPSVSTHGVAWVYATPKLGVVGAYLGNWDDLDLAHRLASRCS